MCHEVNISANMLFTGVFANSYKTGPVFCHVFGDYLKGKYI